ncbi:unnamed protein product [Phaedon cochleariae]|uniref:THAP-type domain-containing protein n=1 Tax=Phaedon cochleariae TaxID=80249 RepID=A0A9P0GKG7_PHACE|nr:unnamed protein product [Phaedon cochleariae]
MSYCMVLWCPNKGQIPGISYFRLTKSRHDAWMIALGRDPFVEKLSTSNMVCSEHFNEADKIYKNKLIRLKPDVVPTLKLKKQREILFENRRYLNRADEDPASGTSEEPVSIVIKQECENTGEQSSLSREYYFVENEENYPDIPVTSTPVIEICSQKSSSSPESSISIKSMKAAATLQRLKRKLTSSNSNSSKGVSEKIKKDVKLMHNYSSSPKKILQKLKEYRFKYTMTQKKLKANKLKTKRLSKKVSSMRLIISDLKRRKCIGCLRAKTFEEMQSQ